MATLFKHIFNLFVIYLFLIAWSTRAEASVTYQYDAQHRLIAATYDNGSSITYAYDVTGNRVSLIADGPVQSAYEDGEDGNIEGWDIYDNEPTGAIIENVYDDQRNSRVISFSGSGTSNGYRLRNSDSSYWHDSENAVVEWSMRYIENFVVYIAVQTSQGFRYLSYTSSISDNLGDGTYVHHGLGNRVKDGSWHTIIRDLEYDLKEAQPDNELEEVLGFLIRGNGRVDDITIRNSLPASLDSDGDGITDIDEMNTYGTHPHRADSDGDLVTDGEELAYWGGSWNEDLDGDGLINIMDSDSDSDSIGDGMEIAQGTDPGYSGSVPTTIVYEDAEDGGLQGWDIYDSDPAGASFENIYDDARASRVIQFTGEGTTNGYRLRSGDASYWDDANFKNIEWSMRYDGNFVIYIAVQTSQGFRYLSYTSAETDNLGSATYVHHGLGATVKDGNWHTVIRDLEYDLKEAQPDNELEKVLGFLIRGSGRVDDIKTHKELPATLDSDGDTITDIEEMNTYGTHPYHADSDKDGIPDNDELAFWGSDWNSDPDNDGLININDIDSDNDTFTDGQEIEQGSDPADAGSYPNMIIYEDGEDGSLAGWGIYDNDPAGSVITTVYDDLRGSQVIEFIGAGTANGYRLRSADFSYWNDSHFTTMEWSMRFSESFVVYIAAQTSDGFRYIYYTSADSDNLGDSTYVHHGLGSQIRDGNWQTIRRDLEADLKEAQPDNELEEVLGFLIRGSGRVDDIKTSSALPTTP